MKEEKVVKHTPETIVNAVSVVADVASVNQYLRRVDEVDAEIADLLKKVEGANQQRDALIKIIGGRFVTLRADTQRTD